MLKGALLKSLIVALPAALFVGLLWNYLVPFGEKTVRYTVGGRSPYIQRLLPDERVKDGELVDEPVYFSVFPPAGNFTAAEVTVDYSTGDKAVLELGLLKDMAAQAFDFRPLANTFLNSLGWASSARADGTILYSRNGDFPVELDRVKTAIYKAEFPGTFELKNYSPLSFRGFPLFVVGSQEFLTYLEDEPFSFTASYSDVNLVPGADEGVARVYSEDGELMLEQPFVDDGDVAADGVSSTEHQLSLQGDGWVNGVYRIVISTTSDLRFRSVTTDKRRIVAKNLVSLADTEGKMMTLYTNAKHLAFEATSSAGIQTVDVAGERVDLKQAKQKVKFDIATPGLHTITIPHGNVKITGEGLYAFTDDSFFDPYPESFSAFMATNGAGIDYVLAVPSTQAVEFSLANVPKENGAYKFAFSLPTVADENGGATIKSIAIMFKKDASFASFLASLRHFVKELIF